MDPKTMHETPRCSTRPLPPPEGGAQAGIQLQIDALRAESTALATEVEALRREARSAERWAAFGTAVAVTLSHVLSHFLPPGP